MDAQGNIFVAKPVSGEGQWPATPGAFQAKFGGGKSDFAIGKFSRTGKLLAATYLGGSGDEINGPDTISVDRGRRGPDHERMGHDFADYPGDPRVFPAEARGEEQRRSSRCSRTT